MGAIEDVYEDLEAEIGAEEFREKVEEKVEQMGGLADEETAALLIAHELDDADVEGVADLEAGMDEVSLPVKVMAIGSLRQFERDDGDPGQVINVEVADETGRVAASFWDGQAQAIDDGEIERGDVIRLRGSPREGYDGLEISVHEAQLAEDLDIDVEPKEGFAIEDIVEGLSDVTLNIRVLDTDTVRTFERDDGTEGRVSNLMVGDETGRIRVTLWDDQADLATELEAGECIAIHGGYTRERDGNVEVHLGSRGRIEELLEPVEYNPETDPIDSLEFGDEGDIGGVVRSSDQKRTFERSDGSEGQVRNIRLQDETGDIRVALWGEKADRDIGPGDEIVITDVEIQEGYQDSIEASAGWQSSVTILETDDVASSPEQTTVSETAGESDSADTTATPTEPEEGEELTFTGTVVQAGSPVILDGEERTMAVETDTDVTLGQEVTVRGRYLDGRLQAEDLH